MNEYEKNVYKQIISCLERIALSLEKITWVAEHADVLEWAEAEEEIDPLGWVEHIDE